MYFKQQSPVIGLGGLDAVDIHSNNNKNITPAPFLTVSGIPSQDALLTASIFSSAKTAEDQLQLFLAQMFAKYGVCNYQLLRQHFIFAQKDPSKDTILQRSNYRFC
jgi:hypothetical protein